MARPYRRARLAALTILAGCRAWPEVELGDAYVDIPADADCRDLLEAHRDRGWSVWLDTDDVRLGPEVVPTDEVWVLDTRVRWIPYGTALVVRAERPRGWSGHVSCPSDYEAHEIDIQTCRVGRHRFGVVDPTSLRALEGRGSPSRPCHIHLGIELARGRETTWTRSVVFRRSLRPFLEEPR